MVEMTPAWQTGRSHGGRNKLKVGWDDGLVLRRYPLVVTRHKLEPNETTSRYQDSRGHRLVV